MGKKSLDKRESGAESVEHSALIVSQPQKLEGLLETITLIDRVSERLGEDRSGDWGGGGGAGGDAAVSVARHGAVQVGGAGAQAGGQTKQTARDKAIKNLPKPELMKQKLTRHIEKEVKSVRKQIRKEARRASKPGSAHRINELYARVRRLNSLLSGILDAGYDVVKRLFIRTFIDKQTVI